MKIGKCVARPTEFNAIKMTEELGDELIQVFKNADKLDEKLDRPINHWKAMFEYHGLVWSNIWGFEFIANYGKENQQPRKMICLNDRIIKDKDGNQYLIGASEFQKYFLES